jgi:Tol biopolymer transport system component
MPASGGKPVLLQQLTGDSYFSQWKWAPDSRHLAAAEGDGVRVFDYVRDTAKLVVRGEFGSGPGGFDFSPDSRSLVFEAGDQRGDDLYVLDLQNGHKQQITHGHMSFNPVWGPSAIAFARFPGSWRGDVWLTDPQGKRARQLTHTRAGISPAF